MKIVIGGPPQSGKSTFTASLIQAIRERQRNRPYQLSFSWQPLDVTDNSIAVLLNPDEDIEQKRDVEWTEERAEERRAVFEARDEQLVVADAPGLITDELRIVLEPADAIIILANYEEQEKIADWRDIAESNDMQVFAELTSILDEDLDPGWDQRESREGIIRSIEREEFGEGDGMAFDDTTRRMIRQVATDLLKLCSQD
jgi:molybdopterin-guanine dinucleotide biosynthesis protein